MLNASQCINFKISRRLGSTNLVLAYYLCSPLNEPQNEKMMQFIRQEKSSYLVCQARFSIALTTFNDDKQVQRFCFRQSCVAEC